MNMADNSFNNAWHRCVGKVKETFLIHDTTGRLLEPPKDNSRIVYLGCNTVCDLSLLNCLYKIEKWEALHA